MPDHRWAVGLVWLLDHRWAVRLVLLLVLVLNGRLLLVLALLVVVNDRLHRLLLLLSDRLVLLLLLVNDRLHRRLLLLNDRLLVLLLLVVNDRLHRRLLLLSDWLRLLLLSDRLVLLLLALNGRLSDWLLLLLLVVNDRLHRRLLLLSDRLRRRLLLLSDRLLLVLLVLNDRLRRLLLLLGPGVRDDDVGWVGAVVEGRVEHPPPSGQAFGALPDGAAPTAGSQPGRDPLVDERAEPLEVGRLLRCRRQSVVGRHFLETLLLLRRGRLQVALASPILGPTLAHDLARRRFIVAGAHDCIPEGCIKVGLQAAFGGAT